MSIGWDSVEAVSKIHSWAEILGIVFLGLLVVAEIVAYVSGGRKDALMEAAHNQQLTAVRERVAGRRLSDEQKQLLISALQPFEGQPISVDAVMGDTDAHLLGTDFVSVFVAAGWKFPAEPTVGQAIFDNPIVGVRIWINQDEPIPPAAFTFRRTLEEAGIPAQWFNRTSLEAGQINVIVGGRE